jgi:hypothetical protein
MIDAHRLAQRLRRPPDVAGDRERPWFLLALFLGVLLCGAAVPLSAMLRGVVRFGRVTVPAQTEWRAPLLVVAGPVNIVGRTDAPVVVLGGPLALDGEAADDVITLFGAASLGPGATALGNAISVGSTITVAPTASVAGSVIGERAPWPASLSVPNRSVATLIAERLRLAGMAVAALLLLGIAVWTVLPWPALVTTATARRCRVRSVLLGLGAVCWAPLLIAPLAVSLAGLPLAALLLCGLAALWGVGVVSSAVRLGHRVLAFSHRPSSMLTSTLTGLILLGLLPAVPLIGSVMLVLAGCVGIGGALLALWDREASGELSVMQALATLKFPE